MQPALQKFARIESRYKIKSGENEDTHVGRLLAIYEEEMKNSKDGILKEFSKYLEACIWLKGEPKFGTNSSNPAEAVEENILMSKDVSISGMETDCVETKLKIGCNRAKMQKKVKSKKREFDSTTKFDGSFNEQVNVFEQSLKKLNTNTKLFLKHQMEGID